MKCAQSKISKIPPSPRASELPVAKRIASTLLATLFLTAQFLPALAIAPSHKETVVKSSIQSVPQPPKGVRTGPRTVKVVQAASGISSNATDTKLIAARVFLEPLAPMTTQSVNGENQALASALNAFRTRRDSEDVSSLTGFVSKYPTSRWRPSIENNLAEMLYQTGQLSKAIAAWTFVWNSAKSEKGAPQIAVANHAMANLLQIYARLGRKDDLKTYFDEIKGRPFYGSDETKLVGAQHGYSDMLSNEKYSFKCGPYAINSLLNLKKGTSGVHPELVKASSTANGTNLAQLLFWADSVGLKMQAAKRSNAAPLVVPSIMHWSLDHFAAILAQKNGKYLIADPTFGNDGHLWISQAVLDAETDGYFLVPADVPLPSGWSAVSTEEAKNVWGKGGAEQACHDCMGCNAPSSGEDSCKTPDGCPDGGMAKASAYSMQATLKIADKPLFYQPPVGPAMDFVMVYDHLETNQPSTFTFTNLGHNWLFNWLSYLTVDPITSVVTLRKMGGGSEIFTPDVVTGLYSPDLMSQAKLVLVSPGVYRREMPDGSAQVYNQSDATSPPRIFMTQVIDKAGNAALVQFDANMRITTITDAIGQVSTLAYISNTPGNIGFYKIASISDPFSRTCSFIWDSTTTRLLSITDMIGLKSEFTWDASSSFITTLTTPYGTTSFYKYIPTYTGIYPAQGLRITYPDGTSEVIESYLSTDQITYYWDRHATELYPADPANQVYTHCEKMKWVLDSTTRVEKPIMQYAVHPLESTSPIYYRSQGQGASADFVGSTNKITQTQRSLGNAITMATVNGTVTGGDIFYISADGQGGFYYTVQPGDTFATIAANLVATTNSNASMQSAGVTAVQASPTSFSLQTDNPSVTQFKFYPNPGVTTNVQFRSQSMQTAVVTIGGTMTTGDTVNLDIALPHPNNFSERITHTVVGGDTPTTIAADMASKINANALLALSPTTATSTGGVLNISSYSSRVVFYGPFIGGANTETIAVSDIRNGTIQLSTAKYNSLGLITESVDPVNRKFSYVYDSNNIDLLQIKETQGSHNFQISAQTYNSNHMPLTYTDGSGRVTTYTYNSLQQPLTITDANSNVTTMTYTGTSSATIGGTVTAGNILTITVHDPALSGGLKAVNYTVIAGNTLTAIATGLKNAINADASLQAIGVSATSSAAVITMKSTSVNVTTYTQSVSGGSTETIALGPNTFGYLTQIDGPLAGNKDVTTFTWDGYGRLFTQTSSTGYILTFNYDAMNRPIKTTYPDSTTEQTVWDRLDAVMSKDRNGRWSQKAFDSMDDLVYEIDPLGRKTQYTWCTCGSMVSLTDPANHTTTWQHDLQGRTTRKVYADSTAVNYVYDPSSGNLRSKTDALSQKTVYSYYPDDRNFQKTYKNAINPTASVTTVWDQFYERVISAYKPDWGTITYTYNPYILPGGSATTGGGRLQLIHNDRMANSDISFVYDNLGRTTNRSINGAANSNTWAFDAIGRVTSEVNALGTFNFAYIDDASGSSKGSSLLASVAYPNSQVTKYSWYPAAGDERLQQIANLKTGSGPTISQFAYRYDPAGQITQWQQLQGNSSVNLNLGYDEAGQLSSSQAGSGGPSAAYLKQNYFAYDVAANRTAVQQVSVNRVKLGGTVTTGNTLTITVKDFSLTGGQEAVTYTVVGGDTLSTIATKLAAAITANANLIALGVNASANGSMMSIKSASTNITTYAQSTNVGATETITLGVTNNFVENAVISGTKTTGNTLTITVMDAALSGGSTAISYTVLAGDTLTTMTTGLKNAINSNAGLSAAGITATSVGTVITLKSTSSNATTYSQSTSSGATATIALSINQNETQTIGISGTKTTGDTLTITVYDAGLAGGLKTITYTVLSGDTLASIANGLASALTADVALQAIGVSATSSGRVVTIQSNSIDRTILRNSTSASATEIMALNIPTNGVQTAVIGGSKTTGDTLTLTVYCDELASGVQTITYTVLAADTLTSIAAGLASAISANTNLANVGISANASSTVINIQSTSISLATYAKSANLGATETITLAPASAVSQYSYNNVNELTSVTSGGVAKFQATSNKALKLATINSAPARLSWSKGFDGNATLSTGANTVSVQATDGASTTKTSLYQVPVIGVNTSIPSFDANGNMLSNGANVFAWDAERRLIKITYSGIGNYSAFTYTPDDRLGQISEYRSSVNTDTKQFIVSNIEICEERDGSIVKKFFSQGQIDTGTPYYYATDHLSSIRELVTTTGFVTEKLSYDVFGSALSDGAGISDFRYAGYYFHSPSQLSLATFRAYDASLGRWLTRDFLSNSDGVMYTYVDNKPIRYVDPQGLWGIAVGTEGGGYTNLGVGNPSFLFTAEGVATNTTQGAAAVADGINPFGDPFQDAGVYDPNVNGLGTSQAIGVGVGMIGGAILGLRGGAAIGATRKGSQIFNRNPYIRLGPGRMGKACKCLPAGPKVPRLSIGRGPNNLHIDLRARPFDSVKNCK